MAHEIETAAFNWENGAPWHGLGEHLPPDCTVDEMVRLAGIGWEVALEPMYRAIPVDGADPKFEQYSGRNFLTRQDTLDVLDVTGPDYRPIQNRAATEFVRSFVEADEATGDRKATIEAAGSLRGGRFVWVLVKMNAGFEFQRGDRSEAYMLALKPHQQGQAFHILPTSTRVVCMNTTRLALGWDGEGPIPTKEGQYTVRHNEVWDDNRAADAREFINATREGIVAKGTACARLAQVPATQADAIRVLAPVFQPATEMMTVDAMIANPNELLGRPMRRVLQAIDHAPGAAPGSLWGIFNGVTYYTDHMIGKSRDIRLTSQWQGEGAGNKARVLRTLTEMAA